MTKNLCNICNKRPANYIDTYKEISVAVCKYCLQMNKAERLYNAKQLAMIPLLHKKNYVAAKNKAASIIKNLSQNKPLYVKQWLTREYLDWLSHLYYESGKYQYAIDAIRLRLRKKTSSSYSTLTDYLILAGAYFKKGDTKGAKKSLEKALMVGIKEKEPSAISALEKLREYYGKELEFNPLYAQAIKKLCKQKKIAIPDKFKSIGNTKELITAIDWLSSIKKMWF